jgi:hypothetical protein
MDDLTDFDREGFFGAASLGVFTYVQDNYGELLDVYYRLNRIVWPLQYTMNVPKPENDIRRAWCAVLYTRTLNFTQSAIMLATKGMRVQADTQHRCALETLFKLGALTNDAQFIIDYDLAEQKDNIKHGQSFIQYLDRQKPKDKAQIRQIKASCKDKEATLITKLKKHQPNLFDGNSDKDALRKFSVPTALYAKKADRLDMYDLNYRLGSASVHSDAKSIEDGHFEHNEDGTVNCLKNEPDLEDLEMFIQTLCIVVLDAVRYIGKVLEEVIPEDELRDVENTLEKLHMDAGSTPKQGT